MKRLAIASAAALLFLNAADPVASLDLKEARELPWLQYVNAEVARPGDRVLPPPPDIAVYFGSHAKAIERFREVSASVSLERRDMRTIALILVAHGLSHREWDDLRATWSLTQTLSRSDDHFAPILTLIQARLVNAAVRKMPYADPPWLQELFRFDARAAMREDTVRLAEVIRQTVAEEEYGGNPLERLQDAMRKLMMPDVADAYIEALRGMATSKQCDVDRREFGRRVANAMATWNFMNADAAPSGEWWHRAARFTAERELTAKVLEIKAGRTPSSDSQCSDGKWIVTQGHIRFSKPIDGTIPLEY